MSVNERLAALHGHGMAIWIDALSRDELDSGRFQHLVREMSITGVTSNPSTFAAALRTTDRYEPQIAALLRRGECDPRELFWALALADVQTAAALLHPVYDDTSGRDGFVSFECTPDVADDTLGTVRQAADLHRRIDRPNVMIKVPGTAAGVDAIKVLTTAGISINVTLLFCVDRYSECLEAYQAGLEARLAHGRPLTGMASVASLFLSRLDAKADAILNEDSVLHGEVALASAAAVLSLYRQHLDSPRWLRLAAAGAQPQRPLWASVAPKSDRYSDVHYVERLVAPGTIVTMSPKTLEAFADHGRADAVLDTDARGAAATLVQAARVGIDFRRLAHDLEREGIASFCTSYAEVLDSLTEHIEGSAGRGADGAATAAATSSPSTGRRGAVRQPAHEAHRVRQ
jgi:transaldolase